MDEEVIALIKDAHHKAYEILSSNQALLHDLAAYLLEKETITGEVFQKILDEN